MVGQKFIDWQPCNWHLEFTYRPPAVPLYSSIYFWLGEIPLFFLYLIFSSFFLYFPLFCDSKRVLSSILIDSYTLFENVFFFEGSKKKNLLANPSFFSLDISSNFQPHWQIVWYVSILHPKWVFFAFKYSSIFWKPPLFSSTFFYFSKKSIPLFFSKPRTTPVHNCHGYVPL